MKEVAASAGVSVGTVSNVLNAPDKVSPATVARVYAAISRLGFVRNDAARQLRAGRSCCVGLIVLDIGNPFFSDIARAAEQRAAENDLVLLLGSTDDDASRERVYLETFEEQRVRGVLISPARDDLNQLRALRDRGVPVVLVDRAGSGTPFSSVAVDDSAGGLLAAQHLCQSGRRHIAFVGGPLSLHQIADRLAGARRALLDYPDATLEVIETSAPSVLAGRRAGERLAATANGRPEAIFCANDLLAIGVLQALTLHGIRVPTDIALIGYDDIAFAQSALVPLSSVRQPSARIGSTAIDLLVAVTEDQSFIDHISFQPTLVPRASTVSV
ncbi:LacI family DNA-binding transcriptional regulator [Nocardia mexicana]|nr:LacI family DNA-binding transcriptional regulator [Nocardia mexicana]